MVAAALAGGLPAAASAAGAASSAWDKGPHVGVRLIGGAPLQEAGGTVLRAGLEIALEPGWKTYWRYPGDSGVPPRISFAGSHNVKDVTVQWPAPMRFDDGGGAAIGYVLNVVFPLQVTPRDPAQPVLLRMDIEFGVCERLCVPVDAKAELQVSTKTAEADAALRASEARVPQRVALGAPGRLGIVMVRREPGSPLGRVVVDVAAAPDAKVDLFAEGPNADWALPLPQPIDGAPAGLRRFAFELDGLPPGATATGATLTLTATAGAEAVEVSAPLD